jgi:hypothetical protein
MQTQWWLIHPWKAKPQGQVWVVADDIENRGYFKFAFPNQWYYSGPLLANELIAADLAKLLGYPVAQLEEAIVLDQDANPQKGVVSLEVSAPQIVTWHDVNEEVVKNPEQYVNQIELLSTLVVFDAWIVNVDRASGKNLVLYRNHSSEKYHWYLIDHGLALYGSPRKWKRGDYDSPFWNKLWMYYHVPKGLLRLQSSASRLEPMIGKIESLKESDIENVLSKVSQEYFRDEERYFIKRLLLYRQKRLRKIMKQWLEFKGVKEYGSDWRRG